MRKLVMIFSVVMVIFTTLLGGCTDSQTDSGITVGKIAPDFQLLDTNGNQVALSDFRGRPVMLNFWATWCTPCQFEMPLFQEIYEDEKWLQEELVILAVNLQDSANDIKQFMTYMGLTFTVLLDTNGLVGLKYNTRNIPVTYFIDKDGIIKDVAIGAFINKAALEQKLNLITD
jgi:peroxiredoxin